ncbi:hypothetical protein N7517_001672 [Penicillium concentricum]|uniref:DUF7702 domain-containing protein n=1 Tax=Penicillium concentricum TaxID=293559 RepID=A0A9W9SS98_9EURO|nr:uncharacterized protein N7517_001672 [Penicillium concentricum]KAJ5383761.1 hypothetical protein N7517_001672 [Penicillium concentricum]
MLGSHSKLSIAQIVFYIPVTAIALYLACYRHKRPRMAWIILTFFSLVRITAGILVIIAQNSSSTGVMIASVIFLNAGMFPLIAATLGFIRIIVALEREMSRQIRQCLVVSRILFIVGIGLTVAGGALEGSDTNSDVLIGIKLVKSGYIIVVVFVGCLLAMQVYFWTNRSSLSVTSRTILNATALATPFIAVRIVYLFLSVFEPTDLRWNDLSGPVTPFLTMGLLMEYSVVSIYLITGFMIPSWRNIQKPEILLSEATR